MVKNSYKCSLLQLQTSGLLCLQKTKCDKYYHLKFSSVISDQYQCLIQLYKGILVLCMWYKVLCCCRIVRSIIAGCVAWAPQSTAAAVAAAADAATAAASAHCWRKYYCPTFVDLSAEWHKLLSPTYATGISKWYTSIQTAARHIINTWFKTQQHHDYNDP